MTRTDRRRRVSPFSLEALETRELLTRPAWSMMTFAPGSIPGIGTGTTLVGHLPGGYNPSDGQVVRHLGSGGTIQVQGQPSQPSQPVQGQGQQGQQGQQGPTILGTQGHPGHKLPGGYNPATGEVVRVVHRHH